MMLSYKFRTYSSKPVQEKLSRHLEVCRWLYNRLLEEYNKARSEGKRITRLDTQSLIIRLYYENSSLRDVYSKVLQMVNHQVWSNIEALKQLKLKGRKVGKLRHKGAGRFKTLNYNQSGFKVERKQLILSKIGSMPIKVHRNVEGVIKGVIVKREQSGKCYAIFQVEYGPKPLPKTWRPIGVDLNVDNFLTDSEGRQIENPGLYENTLDTIRRRQKELSRKEKDSKNHERTRIKLAKAHERLVDQRDDFLHKLSKFYIENHDTIAVEDLRIANMTRSSLASRILDASWGKFLHMLSYKTERAGRKFVKVDPRGTSREDNGIEDRHYRAAVNILSRAGLEQSYEPLERGPILRVTAQAVISGQAFSMKQEALPFREGSSQP